MKRILVIDDDDFIRMVMVKILQDCGYETEESSNGTEASAMLKKNHYDLVVTDAVIIPENGTFFAEYVRKNNPDMPVLVVSSHSLGKNDSDVINVSKRFGHERLQKPFQKKQLLQAAARLMNFEETFGEAI